MPPKKNLKLSAVRLRRISEFSRRKFLAVVGGDPVGDFTKSNTFGLIQEYCTAYERSKSCFNDIDYSEEIVFREGFETDKKIIKKTLIEFSVPV